MSATLRQLMCRHPQRRFTVQRYNKICGCARKIAKNSDISVLRMAHLYPKCYELKDFGNPVNATVYS